MSRPYSESCDENRRPILEVIEPLFRDRKAVLEIGSGTGQHAVYFSEALSHLTWHTSDRRENHPGIQTWLTDFPRPNVRPPIELDVSHSRWPDLDVDAVFSANTCHIMHWRDVENFFAGVGTLLSEGGMLVIYGPFNVDNRYTSDSNARFDQWLKARDPGSGIRDRGELDTLANRAGMTMEAVFPMPANNMIVQWRKGRT